MTALNCPYIPVLHVDTQNHQNHLLFCLCYVRLVRPVFFPRCECCVTVLGWKCGANVVKEYTVLMFQLFRDQSAGRLHAFVLASEMSLTRYLPQHKMFPQNIVLNNETHLIPNTGLPSM